MMEDIQIDSSSKRNSIDMEDLEGSSSGGSTMGYSDDNSKYSAKSSSMHSDPLADWLL